jgi:benzoyl-CoA reductase/2-hydroxyglutaryl-CoA dehydratase subunit BcrC/BadD/HgdB
VVALAKELEAKGVIHFALNFCQPYAIEAFRVGALEAAGIPMLSIETDYSMEDVAQFKTRGRPSWRWQAEGVNSMIGDKAPVIP